MFWQPGTLLGLPSFLMEAHPSLMEEHGVGLIQGQVILTSSLPSSFSVFSMKCAANFKVRKILMWILAKMTFSCDYFITQQLLCVGSRKLHMLENSHGCLIMDWCSCRQHGLPCTCWVKCRSQHYFLGLVSGSYWKKYITCVKHLQDSKEPFCSLSNWNGEPLRGHIGAFFWHRSLALQWDNCATVGLYSTSMDAMC